MKRPVVYGRAEVREGGLSLLFGMSLAIYERDFEVPIREQKITPSRDHYDPLSHIKYLINEGG